MKDISLQKLGLLPVFCAFASIAASAENTFYYWGDGSSGKMPVFDASAWSVSSSGYVAPAEGTNINSPDANWVFDYDAHLPASSRREGIYFNISEAVFNLASFSIVNYNYDKSDYYSDGVLTADGSAKALFISNVQNAYWNIGEFNFTGGSSSQMVVFGASQTNATQQGVTIGTVNVGGEGKVDLQFGGDASALCKGTVGDKAGQDIVMSDSGCMKYLTVTGDFNIVGESTVGLNVWNEDASAVHSENTPDVAIDGVVRMSASSSGKVPTLNLLNRVGPISWNEYKAAPGATDTFIKVGGLDGRGNLSNNSRTLDASTVKLIFTNKEDCDFSGTFTENRSDSIKTVMSVKMAGENGKRQIIRADSAFTGTVEVESGVLIIHSTAALGKLTMTGGGFGGIEGGVSVSGAEWFGGDIVFHNTETFFGGLADKITIDGTFTKSAEGKIGVDFSGLDASGLIDEGNNVFDLITANALEGSFSSDANDDFEAKNLLNAIADFAWVGNTLTVTFSQVPEPAAVAALIGALALGVAAWRRRR